jgi:hypothetical protein
MIVREIWIEVEVTSFDCPPELRDCEQVGFPKNKGFWPMHDQSCMRRVDNSIVMFSSAHTK